MKSLGLRQASLLGLSLVLAACGAHDGSPLLPTSAKGGAIPGATTPVSGVATHDPSTQDVAMQTSVGEPPEGFVPRFRVDPRPDADGIIRGDSPLTVKFDLCGSTPDAGKTLFYLYDWDFDNVANVVGTGDACEQENKYRLTRDATDGNLETNVCVVNGDPRGPDRATLFFSCRTYRVSLPVPPPVTSSCGTNDVSFAGQCYYLDGSGGVCDPGYALVSQSVLTSIAPLFAGLDYKNTVSSNCCIWNADPDEDWGMNASCNSPGPFQPGEPVLDGAGCTDAMNFEPQQLTLCGN